MGGVQTAEVLHVALLVAVKGGAEFKQDQALAADKADFEGLAVFPGAEFLPELRREQGEINAMEGSGTIEPIQIESEFFRAFAGGLFHSTWWWVGTDDVTFPFA